MSELTIQNLNKKFKETSVLEDININLETGEFLVLLGPSGCGKSTLLRIIAGLESFDSGTITLDHRVLNDIKPKDRDIAMVFQAYALYPNLTVHDNIAFGLKIRKVNKQKRKIIINDLVKMLKIEKHLHKKPAKLSGGERQRVAIARALARNPKLFLFDEPLSNLDAKLRQQMRIEIKRLHKKLKITSVYVTHDQIEAMTLGDVIIIMKDQKIQQIGSPQEIYEQPSNLFVAGFIGSPPMNFIPADVIVRKKDSFLQITSDEKSFLFPVSKSKDSSALKKYSQVILGIRPVDIIIEKGSNSVDHKIDKKYKIQSKIKLIEYTGEESLITTEINNTQIIIRAYPGQNLSLEGKVEFTFDMTSAFLFEKESGKRIL